MRRASELWLTALIVVLALPVHLIGLLHPAIYRDPAVIIPQNLGTDLVTLAIGIPLLILSTAAMRRGSLRARVLWLGTLGYLGYAYGMYSLGVVWNQLFLAYLALFGLSLFGFILGVAGTDPVRLRVCFAGRAPIRLAAGYLLVVAVAVAAMWLAEEVGALLTATVPATVTEFQTPTNIVHVFDLGVVLPAMVLAAVMLRRDRPWGYLLAGVLIVKAAAIALWVVAMIWFSARAGVATPLGYTLFFGALAAGSVAVAWRFLARIDSGRLGAILPHRGPLAWTLN